MISLGELVPALAPVHAFTDFRLHVGQTSTYFKSLPHARCHGLEPHSPHTSAAVPLTESPQNRQANDPSYSSSLTSTSASIASSDMCQDSRLALWSDGEASKCQRLWPRSSLLSAAAALRVSDPQPGSS